MYTTPNMSLVAWDLDDDAYDHNDLVNNWVAIDQHDHTPGRGVSPLPVDAIPVLGQDNLEACSVDTLQLCDGAVTTAKLEKCSVTTLELCDNAVTNPKIADGAVDTDELADGAVTEAKLEDDSVTTNKVVNSGITNIKINNSAVSEPKLAANAVSTSKIQDGAVTSVKIGDGEVKENDLDTDAVTQDKVATNAIGHLEHHAVPAGYLDLTHTVNISSGSEHAITWHQALWDNGSLYFGGAMWDGTAGLRAPVAGLYLFEAGVMMDNPGAGGGMRMKLVRNGSTVASQTPAIVVDGSGEPYRSRMSASTVLYCNVGDVMWTKIFQNSGSVLTLNPDNRASHQSLTWIAPPPGGWTD